MCDVLLKNMNLYYVLFFLLALNTTSDGKGELKLTDRVRFLKETLQRELRAKHGGEGLEPINDFNVEASYEFDDESPITPIMDKDALKRDDKFKLKRLKTTTVNTPPPFSSLPIDHQKVEHEAVDKALRVKSDMVSKPLDIFYRKAFSGTNTPIPWLHCSEMISPYIQGAKKEMTRPIPIGVKDHVVLRLIQLLNMNTTALTKDEVYSILYQISKLKIRLWSWSIASIRMLFNVITNSEEQHHSFRSLKRGLKALFDSWRLDRSNTTRLLLQARVFRPPCMAHKHTGSSKFKRGSTVSIITSTKNSLESDECKDQEPCPSRI